MVKITTPILLGLRKKKKKEETGIERQKEISESGVRVTEWETKKGVGMKIFN